MKGTVPTAINWKVILILFIVFLILLFMFQMGIIQKIISAINPVLKIIPG
jgi:hypothetical protein